jgi:hypothetical protein
MRFNTIKSRKKYEKQRILNAFTWLHRCHHDSAKSAKLEFFTGYPLNVESSQLVLHKAIVQPRFPSCCCNIEPFKSDFLDRAFQFPRPYDLTHEAI